MPRTLTKCHVSDLPPYVLRAGDLSRLSNSLDDFIHDPQRMRMMGSRQLRQLCAKAFDEIKRLRMELARAGGVQ